MSTKAEFIRLLGTIGKAGVHALYPNDFEYYLIALELVDSRSNTVDYFVFPIMPKSLSRNEREISTIKKSAGGISVIGTNSFQPIDFSLSGDFGRQLKVVVGPEELNFTALSLSTQNGVFSRASLIDTINSEPAVFSRTLKTGYGATKILSAIVDKSRGLDDYGQPFRLFFYNPSFGESFVVRAVNLSLSQNKDSSNMIWNYQLELKAIAKLEALHTDLKGSMRRMLTVDVSQKLLTQLANVIDRKYNF